MFNTYREIHNMMVEFNLSDKVDLTFKSAVVIMYGLTNNTTAKNKIRGATQYGHRVADFIFHNLFANEIIFESQWNLEDIGDEKTNWMELTLCAMAASGEIVREREGESKTEEKPIKWKDLYNTEEPYSYLYSYIIPKDDEEIFVVADEPAKQITIEELNSGSKKINSLIDYYKNKEENEVEPQEELFNVDAEHNWLK